MSVISRTEEVHRGLAGSPLSARLLAAECVWQRNTAWRRPLDRERLHAEARCWLPQGSTIRPA
jgi:hypothetical protein